MVLQELIFLRDLGVYEKVDEREAIAKYQVAPFDIRRIDTNTAFEAESMLMKSRIAAGEFKSGDRPDLYAGTPPLEALKALISIEANHKETFSIMHVDVSRAHFHAQAQRLVLVRSPAEDRKGADAEQIRLLSTRDAASNWERDWQEQVKNWGYQLGSVRRICFVMKNIEFQGRHTLKISWSRGRQTGLQNSRTKLQVYPIKTQFISYGSTESIKAVNILLRW